MWCAYGFTRKLRKRRWRLFFPHTGESGKKKGHHVDFSFNIKLTDSLSECLIKYFAALFPTLIFFPWDVLEKRR